MVPVEPPPKVHVADVLLSLLPGHALPMSLPAALGSDVGANRQPGLKNIRYERIFTG